MKTIEELINEIPVNRANFEHIAKTGKINGSLLVSLEKMIHENFTIRLPYFEWGNPLANMVDDETKEYILNQHKTKKR